MLRERLCTAVVLMMLVPATSDAREALFFVENRLGGDSNILRRGPSDLEEQDGFYEFVPGVQILERNEELNYRVFYSPTYQTFLENEDLDAWDHTQRASFDWAATPRDLLGLSQYYISTRTLRTDEEVSAAESDLVDEANRERIQRSRVALYYSRTFLPNLQGRLDLEFDDLEFDRPGNVDTRSYGSTVSLTYLVTPRWNVGLFGAFRYRQNRGVDVKRQSRSSAHIGNVALTIAHELTPTLRISARAGPSIVDTEESTPPTSPFTGTTETETTVFATVEIEKQWQRGQLFLSYQRTESASAGDGSSIVDIFTLEANHQLTMRWRARLFASFTRRNVVAESRSVVRFDQDTDNFQASALIERRLTDNLFLQGRVRFSRILRERTAADSGVEAWTGFLALRYNFDPWVF